MTNANSSTQDQSQSQEPEWVTIAQAAQHLGLNERQARRYAERLPDTDRTTDRTPAGRGRALIRLAALRAITKKMRGDKGAGGPEPDTRRTLAGQLPDSDRTAQPDPQPEESALESEAGGPLAVTIAVAMVVQREGYERVISAQAAQIAELQATVAHERETSQRWQEALAREQMLRALPPPQEFAPPSRCSFPGHPNAAPARRCCRYASWDCRHASWRSRDTATRLLGTSAPEAKTILSKSVLE